MNLFGKDEKARDRLYWRNAYETLVEQTGRDLNDGLGRDPRSLKAQPPKRIDPG